jgi:hypothetical protein
MSENNGNSTPLDNATNALVEPWVEYWMSLYEQNTDWTKSLMAGVPPNVDPTTVRRQWMGAMSKSIEAYLRTPAFLDYMRRNSEAMTATKVTSELAKREIARQSGVPHIEDISGLYERLETAHEVLLGRLQSIEDRLTAIEQKLNSKPSKSSRKDN